MKQQVNCGRTVQSSELASLRMAAGNENKYDTVVDRGRVKEWVGIGWIDCGEATAEDRLKYPTVIRTEQ